MKKAKGFTEKDWYDKIIRYLGKNRVFDFLGKQLL